MVIGIRATVTGALSLGNSRLFFFTLFYIYLFGNKQESFH